MRKNLFPIWVILLALLTSMIAVPSKNVKAYGGIDKDEAEIKIGESVTVGTSDADDLPITWSVENNDVAAITQSDQNFAVVTGKKMGTTRLIANTRWGGKYYCEITVYKPKTKVLYNKDGIKVTVKGATISSYQEGRIMLNIQNKTNKSAGIWVDELTINGFLIGSDIVCTVPKKSQANDDIECYSTHMKKNKITNIKSAAFVLQIRDKKLQVTDSKRIKIKF